MEFFKHLTVLIEAENEEETNIGTGFFYAFSVDGKDVPAIVTAHHVIAKGKITLTLRYKVGEHIAQVRFPCNAKWHSMEQHDLACCLIRDIEQEFKSAVGFPMFYRCLCEENTVTEQELKNIKVLSEVVMAGYPAGMSSSVFNYPILQKGHLASDPGDASDNRFVDITTVGGSSGSPLILCGSNPRLIGIMSRAVVENPLSSANIGIYTEACRLSGFKVKLSKKD